MTDSRGRCRALIAKEHLRELTDGVFGFRRHPHLERFNNGATCLAKRPPTTRSITKNSKTQTLGVFAAQVPPSQLSLSLALSNVADGHYELWLTVGNAATAALVTCSSGTYLVTNFNLFFQIQIYFFINFILTWIVVCNY